MSHSVVCTVRNSTQANKIVDRLKAAGFSNSDISVVMPDSYRARGVDVENSTKAPEGAATGGGTGLVLGGALGWLAGIGALAIPGVGPLIAAGPIMAALSGAALGGTLGGITGGLVGLGIPEYEAQQYEGKLKSGSAVISVRSENRAETDRAKAIFQAANAEDIRSSAATAAVGAR